MFYPRVDVAGHRAKVLQDEFRGFRLPRATFPRYHAGLIALRLLERLVRRFRQREHVWLQRAHLLPMISTHVLLQIEKFQFRLMESITSKTNLLLLVKKESIFIYYNI